MQVSHAIVLGGGRAAGRGPLEPADRLLHPSPAVRALAGARSRSLDRALLDGADPAGSRLLAARACMLGSRRGRRALAEGLQRLVALAQGPRRGASSAEARGAVLANSSELHALASLVHGPRPLYVEGLAALSELLCDGCSPAHRGGAEQLTLAISDVRSRLLG